MAPGVRSGKFSTQNQLNKNYESISASSYLHTNPAPLGAPLGAPYNGGEVVPWVSTVDYNKPWFTINEDGEYYCKLCNAFATEGHVGSDKHKNREREPEWYMGGGTAVLSAEYNKPWFEDREGQWYCLLCSQWATDGHLAGDKHRKREACPEYYGSWPGQDQAFDAAQARDAASSSMPAMGYGLAVPSAGYAAAKERPNEPWLEVKEGELYCNLCGSWATDGHLGSDKHKRRAAEPEWYWTPPGGASFPAAASSLPAAMSSPPALTQNPHGEAQRARDGLPAGWTKHFSQEHNDWYYYNGIKKESSWVKPAEGAGGLRQPAATPGASWSVPQAAAAAYPAATQAPAAAVRAAPAPAAEANLPPNWQRHWSEGDSKWYYHNSATNVTQWEAPEGGPAQVETLEV